VVYDSVQMGERTGAVLGPETEVGREHLSTKRIPPEKRLIFALDTNIGDARHLVMTLGDSVQFYKLGLEVLMSGNYLELAKELVEQGKEVLLDFKSFDVPRTVAAAVREARQSGGTFATVHAHDEMLKAAVAESNGIQILAVTVLTSLDQSDLLALGFPAQVTVEELVLSRAKRALDIGCAGVISSGLELPALRADLGDKFVIVVPGIRPVENSDDHKRTVSVEQAFLMGADYIVVGRPIRDHNDPRAAAEAIQQRIAALFKN